MGYGAARLTHGTLADFLAAVAIQCVNCNARHRCEAVAGHIDPNRRIFFVSGIDRLHDSLLIVSSAFLFPTAESLGDLLLQALVLFGAECVRDQHYAKRAVDVAVLPARWPWRMSSSTASSVHLGCAFIDPHRRSHEEERKG